MSAVAARLGVKVDKRTWNLMVAADPEPDPASIEAACGEGVDVVVLPTASADVGRRWSELAHRQGTTWRARPFASSAIPALRHLPSPVSLALGRARLVDAFCAIFPVAEVGGGAGEPDRVQPMLLRPVRLPDPADIPPFPEESRLDPFGQSPRLKLESWSQLARLASHFAADAHRHYLAVTLPAPPRGVVDPELAPWRSVAGLDEVEDQDLSSVEPGPNALSEPPDEPGALLDILQRCLLASCAVQAAEPEAVDWQRRAEALECAGYLLMAGAAAPDALGNELGAYFEIGALVARMHGLKLLHGDVHRANFGFPSEPRPVGERAITYDPGDMTMLGRLPTPRERAQDLAILKANCSYLEWEAAEAGYRFKAPELADQVFTLI